MKKIIPIIILISISLIACDNSKNIIGIDGEIDYIHFLRINDIYYQSNSSLITSEGVSRETLVEIGEIKFRLDGNVSNANYEAENYEAAYLDEGTKVYSLKDYDSTFRVAIINSRNEIEVFESYNNINAKFGNEYLDLSNLEYITINSEDDGQKILSRIDRKYNDRIIEIIGNSVVRRKSITYKDKRVFLEFHFKDGSSTSRSYWYETGYLAPYLNLGEEIGDIFDDYITENQD